VQTGLGEGVQQFGAEDLGQGLVREKIGAFAFRAFGSPEPSLFIDGTGRDNDVDVRVEVALKGSVTNAARFYSRLSPTPLAHWFARHRDLLSLRCPSWTARPL